MKHLIILFIGVALCRLAFADESWTCTEASSVRVSGAIHACGVATGDDENEARSNAFDNADDEFKKVCRASVDCNPESVSARPARTSCAQINGGFKCYRMIYFVFEADKNSKLLKPKHPKLSIGMTVDALTRYFGDPDEVSNAGYNNDPLWVYYYKKLSTGSWDICNVAVSAGRVVNITDCKPSVIGAL